MPERCEAIASADEYCRVETRCELAEGHEGAHFAMLGAFSSRAWKALSFQINYSNPEPLLGDSK
jgi:hypothetical protein